MDNKNYDYKNLHSIMYKDRLYTMYIKESNDALKYRGVHENAKMKTNKNEDRGYIILLTFYDVDDPTITRQKFIQCHTFEGVIEQADFHYYCEKQKIIEAEEEEKKRKELMLDAFKRRYDQGQRG